MNPRLRQATMIAAVVLGGFTLLAVGIRLAHAGAVLPGVTVAGVGIGNLSPDEASARLADLEDLRRSAAIEVAFEQVSLSLTAADFDYRLAHDEAVEEAFEVGRGSNPVAATFQHLMASLGRTVVIEVADEHDEALLAKQVERIAAEIDQDAGIGDLVGDPVALTVEAVPPARSLVVDRDATTALLLAAATSDGPDDVDLPVAVEAPTVPVEAVEAAAARAQAALPAGLTLFADDVEITLTPAELAGMVTVRANGEDDVVLDARPADVERAFNPLDGAFEVEAVDATFAIPRAPTTTLDGKGALTWKPVPVPVTITASTPGRTFDAQLTGRQIGDLLERGVTRAAIALREVRAEFTIDDARALGITHLLGTFTTNHACCQARVANIQRLADLVDGSIVQPGEQFSVNQVSGERTCASGFQPAGMILNGEIVDACGGGVSQFGTTTFNAAFFAGLQLDEWKAHSFYISRYPMGREATLNYPSPDIDVKFTNDTDHGLLIKTHHTSTSITVSIYGQSDVTQVEATRSGTFAPRNFTTQRRPNPALAPGQEVRVQSGAPGFSVRVSRFVTYRDGRVAEREILTVYQPEREIIEYGPGEPTPAPSPSATPTPGPTPTPTPSPTPTPTPTPTPSPTGEPSPEPTSEPPGEGARLPNSGARRG